MFVMCRSDGSQWPAKQQNTSSSSSSRDAGIIMYLGQGAHLHMAQLMSLPLTISCSSKSRLVLPSSFHLSGARYSRTKSKTVAKRLCVCVCVVRWYSLFGTDGNSNTDIWSLALLRYVLAICHSYLLVNFDAEQNYLPEPTKCELSEGHCCWVLYNTVCFIWTASQIK